MSYDYGNGEYDTDDYEYQQDLASGVIVLGGSLEARERALFAAENRQEIARELIGHYYSDEELDEDYDECMAAFREEHAEDIEQHMRDYE